MNVKIACLTLLAAACLLTAGCKEKMVKVTGRLVKDGVVQTFGEDEYVTVSFRPEETEYVKSRSSYPAALKRTEGTYEVELPPGKYYVNVFVPPKLKPGQKMPKIPPPAGDKAAGGSETYDIKSNMTLDLPIP